MPASSQIMTAATNLRNFIILFYKVRDNLLFNTDVKSVIEMPEKYFPDFTVLFDLKFKI